MAELGREAGQTGDAEPSPVSVRCPQCGETLDLTGVVDDFPCPWCGVALTKSGALASSAPRDAVPSARGPSVSPPKPAGTLYCPQCRAAFRGIEGRCVRCDQPLVDSYFPTVCPECGTPNRINRRSCWKCSADLTAKTPRRESATVGDRRPAAQASLRPLWRPAAGTDIPPPTIDLPPAPVFPASAYTVQKPARHPIRTTRTSGRFVGSSDGGSGMSDWDKVSIGLDVACLILSLLSELGDD